MPLFLAYISSPSSLSSGPESKCEVKFESRIQSLELLQRLAEMTCFIDWTMRPQSYCRWRIKSVSHILTNCRLLPRIILMSNEEVPFLVLYQRTLLETLQNEKSLLFEGALFSPLLKLYPWMLNDRSRRVQGAFKERWLAKKLEWPPDIRVRVILKPESYVCLNVWSFAYDMPSELRECVLVHCDVEHLKQGANPGNFCGCTQDLEATVACSCQWCQAPEVWFGWSVEMRSAVHEGEELQKIHQSIQQFIAYDLACASFLQCSITCLVKWQTSWGSTPTPFSF